MRPKVLFLDLVKNADQDTPKSIENFVLSVKIWFKTSIIWFKNMFSQKFGD